MVYMQNSISVRNSIDQSLEMANCVNSSDFNPKPRQKKIHSSPNCSKTPSCEGPRFRSAVVDVVILLAVITACGFLLFPYVKVVIFTSIEVFVPVFYLVKEEVIGNPIIYASIGLSVCCVAIAAWIVILCTTRKCGNPNCKGLRKAAEFDIQLETEECVKESGGGVKKGLFELPRDHHKELEAELKKMAPPNGRAVLIFRARCGCSVGRLEVPGTKKHKKLKK
ncbi:hypothetical protein Patl1_21896 [Pistacia atlantica]|uniref:Uncharacterized protein n=1 Tax=Pistacia atlantica TaxID=434234 RepID=A0ACC1BLU6_9ROSI|nr:hypothetical protein Patl1_21896 [Pistacia atlantica]